MSGTANIFGFVTYKGGVGKTTLSVFISCCLARGIGSKGRPQRVLLVDMDPQANATFMLLRDMYLNYVEEGASYQSMNEVLLNKLGIKQIIQTAKLADNPTFKIPPATIDVAPAIDLMRDTADLIASRPKSDGRLAHALNQVINDYDVIVIDSPPTGGLLTRNVIEASHNIVIPLMPGQSEYDCVGQTWDAIVESNQFRREDEHIGVAGVLPNKFGRNRVSREFREMLQTEYGDFVLPEIPDITLVPKIVNSGYDPIGYATDRRSYNQIVPPLTAVCEAIYG